MGLGYAVTRDLASFLRYSTHDDDGTPNPLALGADDAGISRAYGLGLLVDRDVPARLPLPGIQRGRGAPPGVRCGQHPDPGLAPAVRQRGLRGSEHLLAARRPAPLPLHVVPADAVRGRHRPAVGHPRRHPEAAGDRSARVPDRHRERVLRDEGVAERPRRSEASGVRARQRQAVSPLELPARGRQSESGRARLQRPVREPHEPELQRANVPRAADGAGRLGRPGRGAPAEPLSAGGGRHAGVAGRVPRRLPADSGRRHRRGAQRGIAARLRAGDSDPPAVSSRGCRRASGPPTRCSCRPRTRTA